MEVALREIAGQLGGELLGDGELRIARIATLEGATPDAITFLANPKYRAQLATTRAGCVIVAPGVRDEAAARGAAIVTPDPYLYYARLSQWWVRTMHPKRAAGIHPSAVVDPGAQIAADAVIGPLCVIGAGVHIGAGTRLAARVTVYDGCTIGARCIVHSGVVIGADGFGFAPVKADGGLRYEKIEQLGGVRIGDDVEIGANTCVDRGALDDTVIEDGVKLDNLIQVGHNVRIGAHSAMAGCVGIAGSAVIGKRCTVGGGAIVLGHLTLADDVHISAASVVMRSIRQPGQYSGVFPIDDNAAWEKNAATLRQLHTLRERIRTLEKNDTPRQP
ncbi:UDP-3-O-(3-hydroxymyristoyl)glucosamine N-acyltransferase [Variovorax sp. YR752]|uniref:UDP-3-O-(3-hydroxymyristoyl)glucosamine N-acyltransferase n=1 Tax=Variovorax sp. YR752 TaxID=1884383 RepID=UPI0031378BB4